MFSDFEQFTAAFDCPDTHWAVDVYTPPDEGYLRILNWTCQLHTRGYQLGKLSDHARQVFKDTFAPSPSDDLSVFFVPTGTAANAMIRAAVLDQNKSIILCSEMSHQSDREAGSVEALTGSRALKPLDIFTPEEMSGRTFIDIDQLEMALQRREEKYLNQRPWVISLSVPAEDGSIPSIEYMTKVADFAKRNGMLFHVDGARLFVAAAALGKSLKEITIDIGVDMFSLGGSKVGLIGVDAVVFTPHFYKQYPLLHHYKNSKEAYDHFRAVLKRIGALSGRSEEFSAQFAYALTNDYGISIGRRAHDRAVKLAERVRGINGISIEKPVESNVVAVRMSHAGYKTILCTAYPYIKLFQQDKDGVVVRFMASHATNQNHIDAAEAVLRKIGATCPL